MVDVSNFIAAKSDQLNADDLIGGPITVKVTRVSGNNDKEQPISVYYEGDNGKPYKPGKSMRRVLVNFWGKDGEDYVGRRMTLYRDPDVQFGGIKVGGIRIDAMSDIGSDAEMALAVTRGAKRAYRVKALPAERQRRTPAQLADEYIAALDNLSDLDALRDYQLDERRIAWLDKFKAQHPDEHARIVEAQSTRAAELADDGGGDDGKGNPVVDDDDDTFLGGAE